MVLEVRVGGYKGAQTVFPGSVHESDEEIRWDENGDPAQVDNDDLLKRARLLAAICLFARYWPGSGARHDAALSLGGFLARIGLPAPKIKYLVEAIARTAGDAEHQDRKNTAEDAAQAFHAGRPARGYPHLKKTFGEMVAKQVADWLDYRGSTDDTADSAECASTAEFEIVRLAKLPAIKYEQERRAAAEALGLRTTILDRLVQGERDRLGLDSDDDAGKQGRSILFAEPEPWPEKVDGAALLDEIAKAIGSHVIMPEASQDACALWAAHTYLLDCTMISPRLAITSPTRGCGKTTALDVISQLVLRPLPAANVSASAIFRVVEGFRPTLMIDEADSFLRDNEELRGVLNSGHRKGGAVLRNVGDDHEPRSFSTYSACAIALIGQLPGTLTDRSVPIMLTRRKRDEAITPFRLDKIDHLVALVRKLARWTTDSAEAIAVTEPEIPAGIYNRAADNWRPLLAVATVAGGDWLARGERAALASVADIDEASRLELLLGDIRTIFANRALDRIPSAVLAEALADMEGRPWAEYGRSEKPITPGKLARLLKPLAIVPENIRVGDKVPKGYVLERFKEAFARYLAPEGASEPLHRYNADETGTSDLFRTATAEPGVADRKCEKPNNGGHCSGVADQKGDSGDARVSCAENIATDQTCVQCRGEIDGTERLASVSGRAVWLHHECERFWLRAVQAGES
jgi:putative DNA primase/helicase